MARETAFFCLLEGAVGGSGWWMHGGGGVSTSWRENTKGQREQSPEVDSGLITIAIVRRQLEGYTCASCKISRRPGCKYKDYYNQKKDKKGKRNAAEMEDAGLVPLVIVEVGVLSSASEFERVPMELIDVRARKDPRTRPLHILLPAVPPTRKGVRAANLTTVDSAPVSSSLVLLNPPPLFGFFDLSNKKSTHHIKAAMESMLQVGKE
ncbi:hypothetical protein IWZ00DRAFT_491065 [Phyllosticta capitalensis]|uniref:uncharacterized protein n=1 Tax=Phyllosticta capitalensis TaxID=121624 RepID=UPI00312D71E5